MTNRDDLNLHLQGHVGSTTTLTSSPCLLNLRRPLGLMALGVVPLSSSKGIPDSETEGKRKGIYDLSYKSSFLSQSH
jgi:hypothetical protein